MRVSKNWHYYVCYFQLSFGFELCVCITTFVSQIIRYVIIRAVIRYGIVLCFGPMLLRQISPAAQLSAWTRRKEDGLRAKSQWTIYERDNVKYAVETRPHEIQFPSQSLVHIFPRFTAMTMLLTIMMMMMMSTTFNENVKTFVNLTTCSHLLGCE